MDASTSAGRSPIRASAPRAAVALVVVAVLLLAVGVLHFRRAKAAQRAQTVPTAQARVVRTNVVERQQVAGTLGFRGSYTVYNGPTTGVVTRLSEAGSIVGRGGLLYELDDRPIPLLYGTRPAYRAFHLGMSDGPDVRALKANLLALGFTNLGRLTLDDRFDVVTKGAVEEWQRTLGLRPTGALPLGSVVFLARPIRIVGPTSGIGVGATAQPGAPILAATSMKQAVLVPLDPGSVSRLRVGDRVVVTMPDGTPVPGRVAVIGRVATSSSTDGQNNGQNPPTPTIPVTVDLLRRAAGLDQAPVQVAITTQEDRHVLAIPISALLAQPGGGYAVETKRAGSPQLVRVTTGLFDDVAGRVEVSGRRLRPGMRVEVPAG
jgi:peptidoglycan hydrolase-like protein with peptidoglycan-binding domain